MSRNYDLTLAASGSASQQLLSVVGTRAKLVSSSAGPLRVRTNLGYLYDLLPGQGFRLPDNKVFSEINVINQSGAAVTAVLFIGFDDFIDDRVTGDVSIIDNGWARTALGRTFHHAIVQPANAGAVSYAGVFANGLVAGMAVKKLRVSSAISGLVLLGWGTSNGTAGANTLNPMNMRLGGNVATARMISGTGVGILPTAGEVPGWQLFDQFYVQASKTEELILPTPIYMSGSQVLMFNGNQINRDLAVSVSFEEV